MKSIPSPLQNDFFAGISKEIQQRLLPELKLIFLPTGSVLYSLDKPINHIYFPIDVIAAQIYETEEGASSEVSIIGNDGLVGVLSLLDGESLISRAEVISAGYAFSIPQKKIQDEYEKHNSLSKQILTFIHSLIVQISQTAVCNRHHCLEQRFCRLLLLFLERLPCNNLSITHELISRMLGVRREGVSEVANKLKKVSVIDYHRGHITVLDHGKLEKLSCECYKVVKKESDRLLHPLPRRLWVDDNVKVVYRLALGANHQCAHCFRFDDCAYLKRAVKSATIPVKENFKYKVFSINV